MTAETMVNNLLTEACANRISDIYFLPRKDSYVIEAKNSITTYTVAEMSYDETFSIMNFLKFNSGLDISERRRAQKGSFSYVYQNGDVHIRISSVGDFLNRESLVIRLIYPQENVTETDVDLLNFLLPKANQKGMMIFSGPMGSGKTSLMYTLARSIGRNKKVMCIEDPIEIVEEEFLQLQVNLEAGMTYEELIKTSLRHRPELLIIGEIRDAQTAQQAVQAALCGYTVFTTIHGKSKYSVVQRLEQFGVTKFEIQNAVNLISYQRLIPSRQRLELFTDFLENEDIVEYLQNGNQDLNWRNMLTHAKQCGIIETQVFEEFVGG
ncbi:competence type IV pilus ATPase ComGA [Companilactobacillus ginsenosidimutans]|uniref:Competence protein n=1 Tax=Companilactobacillus ginsenosidimutans TaxID=1007676 RepID=A0A0H4QNC6_9LACO|nr:competence type IV pilus ATPase ComGA [Companilactobacillus ginsenosidimutans]AKP68268.1 competence protein [Companilactobacillus ginsenosidimutans]